MPTTITLPWVSASTCASTCRGLSRNFSTKHSPRPNADTASRTAESNSSGISSFVADHLEPAPAAAERRLDRDRQAVLLGEGDAPRRRPSPGPWCRAPAARRPWSAMCRACTLSPRREIASGEGPIQVSPASMHGLGEVGVLGEEAVAGVDGVGAGLLGRVEDLVDHQVGVARRGAAEREGLVGRRARAARPGRARRRRPRWSGRRPCRRGRRGPRSRRGWRSGPSAPAYSSLEWTGRTVVDGGVVRGRELQASAAPEVGDGQPALGQLGAQQRSGDSPTTAAGSPSTRRTNGAPSPSRVNAPATASGSPVAGRPRAPAGSARRSRRRSRRPRCPGRRPRRPGRRTAPAGVQACPLRPAIRCQRVAGLRGVGGLAQRLAVELQQRVAADRRRRRSPAWPPAAALAAASRATCSATRGAADASTRRRR